jgi:recombination protein RecR
MQEYPKPLARLISELQKLPTIGQKTALRLAFFMLKLPDTETAQIAEAIAQVKKLLCYCDVCGAITDTNPCYICTNPRRDQKVICVVEESDDLWAIERTNSYKGLYHVLGGVLSPLDGTGPEELGINKLLQRIRQPAAETEPVQEVILATNWTTEGQATALYLTQHLEMFEVVVTRIAYGIPVGGDLEYIDEVTLAKALEGRRKV